MPAIFIVKELHADYAVVQISTKFRPPCSPGYVWRQAGKLDYVCVTQQTHEQMIDENKASAKHSRPGGICAPNYVWRGAYQGDTVCVTKQQHDQAQDDNAAAQTRVAWLEYGPLTCIRGYVWRAADASDYVCVTRQIRDQTADENKAYARAGGICAPPNVRRNAFPGDSVCVTAEQHEQVQSDNAAAEGRVQDRHPPGG